MHITSIFTFPVEHRGRGGGEKRQQVYKDGCALPHQDCTEKPVTIALQNMYLRWSIEEQYGLEYERLYGLHIFPIGKAQVSVQLKTKPFRMSIKPPTYQVIPDASNETLCCGAYGNPEMMSGKWVNAFTGEEMDTLIEKEGDLFKIKTNITKKGSYKCRITFLESVIESTAMVKIFERKLILF